MCRKYSGRNKEVAGIPLWLLETGCLQTREKDFLEMWKKRAFWKLVAAQNMLPAFLVSSQMLFLIGRKAVNQLTGRAMFIV